MATEGSFWLGLAAIMVMMLIFGALTWLTRRQRVVVPREKAVPKLAPEHATIPIVAEQWEGSGYRRAMRARREVSPSLRFQILRRDGFRCRYCGRGPPEAKLHVDHVISLADGGGCEPAH